MQVTSDQTTPAAEENSSTSSTPIDFKTIIQSMNERRLSVHQRLVQNRKRLYRALKRARITHLEVDYSGSGDSGQIDSVTLFQDETSVTPSSKVKVHTSTSKWSKEANAWVDNEQLKLMPLDKALEEFVYDWIETEHAGWENNDGASGTCRIDVTQNEFVLNHTSYYTESSDMVHTL